MKRLLKSWLFLIVLSPFPCAHGARLPSGPACVPVSPSPFSGTGSQTLPPPDDVDLIRQKIAQLDSSSKWLRIMSSRYMQLREALAGYCATGVPLVATDGPRYYPAGLSDDLGIYYFIPRLAVLSHLDLSKAIALFFGAPLLASFAIAAVFFIPGLENRWLKIWAVLSLLLLTYSSFRVRDVYSIQTAAVLAIVPWSLHLSARKIITRWSVIAVASAGIVIGFANLIRSHAGTGVAIFLILLAVFHRDWALKQKTLLLAALFAGFLVPTIYFHTLMARRDAFLAAAQPDSMRVLDRHPFWHSAYIGFSFLPNRYVPGYRDELVIDMVHAVDPSVRFLSPEYERIVRTEVLRLIREHPFFAFSTLIAKLSAIGYLLVLYSNLGLLAAALYPKPWPVELAFWSAMAFNSLFGILIIPHRQYLLGFTALATLYGLISIHHALERRRSAKSV